MYKVTLFFNDESTMRVSTNSDFNEMYHFLYSLENSSAVKQFSVSDNFGLLSEEFFGYKKFNKWVERFSYGGGR